MMTNQEDRVAMQDKNGNTVWVPVSQMDKWEQWQAMTPEQRQEKSEALRQKLKQNLQQQKSTEMREVVQNTSLFKHDQDAFRDLAITPAEFYESFDQYRRENDHFEESLNKINPYTGSKIETESDYLEYLREHFFYQLCSFKLANGMELMQSREKEKDDQRERDMILWENKKIAEYEAKLADSQRRELAQIAQTHQRRFGGLALVALILCVACSLWFHHKGVNSGFKYGTESGYENGYGEGYTAGTNDGYEDGAASGYDRGYETGFDAGYATGERVGSQSIVAPSSTTGSVRDTPISVGYIGNVNTHKFHLSTCGHLPNRENQIALSSREEAIQMGYVPCGFCRP